MGKLKGTACWYPFWNGRSYCYDFYVEGQRYRRSTGVRDFEAAEIAEDVAKGVHDAAWERALSPSPTLREAADLYLAEFDKFRSDIERLVAYFGPFKPIEDIDAFAFKRCKVDLKKPSWKSDDTARKHVTTPLRAVLRNALGLRYETRVDNPRDRVLTPEEAERLIEAAMNPPETIRDPHLRLLKIIAFLLGTGATPGEMFCVRAEDVIRATREIRIRGKARGARKTPYRARMVRPPERAWELMGDLPSEGRVFLSTTGKEIVPDGERGSTVIRQFQKVCVAAGLNRETEVDDADADADADADDGYEKLVLYSLRHTWATWFSAQVGDQDCLIDRGGWAKADTARRYRKLAPSDLGERLLAHGWDFRT
ncbi:tyrosine-type recombinase/integrase [Mameliella sp. CS4]|uniref:tyrosine-type recombinase/integrase n=1 Tax=Mameliella sp. CS4 TaxID=2862329 RepID=UPI001C5D132E|nr:tyrosine-type recombinase/integrase [Mameliella sp. CS4]MBW4985150.1 tyrosine-type recombinase/integrase [Mameliella sp. CS4]